MRIGDSSQELQSRQVLGQFCVRGCPHAQSPSGYYQAGETTCSVKKTTAAGEQESKWQPMLKF